LGPHARASSGPAADSPERGVRPIRSSHRSQRVIPRAPARAGGNCPACGASQLRGRRQAGLRAPDWSTVRAHKSPACAPFSPVAPLCAPVVSATLGYVPAAQPRVTTRPPPPYARRARALRSAPRAHPTRVDHVHALVSGTSSAWGEPAPARFLFRRLLGDTHSSVSGIWEYRFRSQNIEYQRLLSNMFG